MIFPQKKAFLNSSLSLVFPREGKSNAHLNGDYQKIGDVMLNNMKVLQLYREYLERQEEILTEIELSTRRNKRFEHAYKEFEAQKVCYLPLNTFLLKPAQRLLHYKLILESKLPLVTVAMVLLICLLLLSKEFEAQKVCYLPLNTFLLKPAQRLLHYKLILESKLPLVTVAMVTVAMQRVWGPESLLSAPQHIPPEACSTTTAL